MAAAAAGDLNQARRLAKANIQACGGPERDHLPIVTSCATCHAQLRSYGDLLADDPEMAAPAQAFSRRVREFSEFLLSSGHQGHACVPALRETVYYHRPCHLRFAHGNGGHGPDAAPSLLRQSGFTEVRSHPHCCGHGGLFAMGHQDLAAAIGAAARADFMASGGAVLTTTCTGCLIQWRLLLAGTAPAVRVVHLAEMLTAEGNLAT